MIKRTILITFTIIVAMTAWGTAVLFYAGPSKAHAKSQQSSSPAQMSTIADKQATVAPDIKNKVFFSGNSNMPEVALTFDDGPNPTYTPQVLAVLQQYNVHATFFTLGQLDEAYPDLIKQEHDAGHVVGNHSWSHPDLTQRSNSFIYTQLADTSSVIQQTTGEQPLFFRPPFGAINDDVKAQATQAGLIPVLWNVDTVDWQLPGSSAIVKNVLDNTSNGSVILMHDGGGDRSQTIAALPQIITGLQQRGFRLVTVQQLVNDSRQSNG